MLVRVLACLVLLASVTATAAPTVSTTYQTLVSTDGTISLPQDFQRTWTFLGTWSVANSAEGSIPGVGAKALHNVYVQPDAISAYRDSGKFPDGTVFIKELLRTTTVPMTTGTVSWGSKIDGWFVMVKDDRQRFPENPLWGDGWGWVLFNANTRAETKDYTSECRGCHIPAQKNDWIYVEGYPLFQGN